MASQLYAGLDDKSTGLGKHKECYISNVIQMFILR